MENYTKKANLINYADAFLIVALLIVSLFVF